MILSPKLISVMSFWDARWFHEYFQWLSHRWHKPNLIYTARLPLSSKLRRQEHNFFSFLSSSKAPNNPFFSFPQVSFMFSSLKFFSRPSTVSLFIGLSTSHLKGKTKAFSKLSKAPSFQSSANGRQPTFARAELLAKQSQAARIYMTKEPLLLI